MGAILATALVSIFVFFLTQVVQKFIIEPYLNLKVALAELSGFLAAYEIELKFGIDRVIGNPKLTISDRLREFSLRLRAATAAILFYDKLCKLPYPVLRKQWEIDRGCISLIALSIAIQFEPESEEDKENEIKKREKRFAELEQYFRIKTSFRGS